VAQHAVSRIACVRAFSPPSAYGAVAPHPRRYGVAATDSRFKSTGQPNYNSSLYIEVSKQYQRDAIKLLRDGGIGALARSEVAAYTVWAQPGDDLLQLRHARVPIHLYADWFDRLVLLRPVAHGWNDPARFTAEPGAFPVGDALGSISYTLLALFALAIYGGVVGWRRGRHGDPVLRCVCVAGLVLIAYSLIVGNALDYRENNRFRVETETVVFVLGALGAEQAWQRVCARRGTRSGRSASVGGDAPGSG
jgi:hypothetical protein